MTLEERQLQEKNQVAQRCGFTLALASLFFAGLAAITGITILICVRIFASVVIMILLPVLYQKLGHLENFRYVVTLSLASLFLMNIFHSSSDQIYTLMYSIIIVVLIYGNASTVQIGCITAIVGLFFADLIDIKLGNIDWNDTITQLIFSTIACYMAVRSCKLGLKQNGEKMAAIQESTDAQSATAQEIIALAEELNQKFIDAQEVSNGLNESMESTHTAVTEIVEGTKNTADSIQLQTSQTAEISENINVVGTEAANIGEISENVENAVNEGVSLIQRLKEQATEVAKINMETSETTQALNNSIQDVQEITETILGISSQTNLLALNASIEAARAGEAGKGFAVVADEIRALSESTRAATEEISAIIERLTKDATSAANSMDKSAEYASKQQELIDQTGEKLSDIKEQTDILHKGVMDVNNSVKLVVDANKEIMDSISNLSATSEEVAASTDTVLNLSDEAMEDLNGMNNTLSEINSIAKQMEEVATK